MIKLSSSPGSFAYADKTSLNVGTRLMMSSCKRSSSAVYLDAWVNSGYGKNMRTFDLLIIFLIVIL